MRGSPQPPPNKLGAASDSPCFLLGIRQPFPKGSKKLFGMRAFRQGTRASYGRPLKKPTGLFFLGSLFGVSSVRLLAPRAPALAVVSRSPRFRPSLACASFRRLRARASQGRTAPLRFAPSLCPSASFGFGHLRSPSCFRLAQNACAGHSALHARSLAPSGSPLRSPCPRYRSPRGALARSSRCSSSLGVGVSRPPRLKRGLIFVFKGFCLFGRCVVYHPPPAYQGGGARKRKGKIIT